MASRNVAKGFSEIGSVSRHPSRQSVVSAISDSRSMCLAAQDHANSRSTLRLHLRGGIVGSEATRTRCPMSRPGVDGGISAGPRAPLQCPFCDAHGWVTLVTRANLNGHTFRWRCTNCDHEWSAVQPVQLTTRHGESNPPLPIPCPKCQHHGSMLRARSITVMMLTCANCRHTWATEYESLPPDIRAKVSDMLQDL
jgi:DNA-directed RNA polymerase subunit M/transcription elongation factor TFIIS